MSRFRIFTGILLQWQIFIILILPFSFFTKIDSNYGKYFDESAISVASFLNTEPKIHLHANLDSGRLYVYINNKLAEYLFVSGGHNSFQTPLGTFQLQKNDLSYSFNILSDKFYIRSTEGSSYDGFPTGIENFSDGDLYLSPHDFELLNSLFISPHTNATLTVSCTSYPWHTISIGAHGHEVFMVQCILKEKGFFTGEPTGYFDEQTKSSVINFQKKSGLFATGAVNAATYFKLTHPINNRLLQ